jgi:hypothetical protein
MVQSAEHVVALFCKDVANLTPIYIVILICATFRSQYQEICQQFWFLKSVKYTLYMMYMI